ncbi:MAG: sulfatase-like hydrolase/transferase, partial [Phycisphaerales bacterium]|nr:sulfatase-like hydrolase/transferase [Phycisphaerales bacterium]
SPHIARYWAMCEWFDRTCAELLDHLETTGHARDTIVLFVTDNGWIQRPDAPGYAPRSKRSPYDGGLRAPIIVRWTGAVEPEVIDTPVSSLDLAPTILRACGVPIPGEMRGIDLLDDDAIARRDTIFGDVHLHNAVDLHDPGRNVTHRWCVQGPWKLILPSSDDEPVELFDLASDPDERTSVASDHPEIVERLTRLTDAWWSGLPRSVGPGSAP